MISRQKLPKSSKNSTYTRSIQIVSQVILISLVNNAAAYIYVYVQYHEASEFVIAIALFLWSQAHGKTSFAVSLFHWLKIKMTDI